MISADSEVNLTSINCIHLETELQNHPDRIFVNFLCRSVRYGFDMLISDLDTRSFECKNSLSARQNPDNVSNLLQQEIDTGFIRGPFVKPPFKNYRG